MDKTSRPKGPSSKSLQDSSSIEVEADSGQAGNGSEARGVYINERGEVCYGDHCVTLAIDENRREVRVHIKRTATCKIDPLIKALRESLDLGGLKTVFEVESEEKPKDE